MKKLVVLFALAGMAGSASASTIAHWRFEEGTPGVQHAAAFDNFYADLSGNGNHLSAQAVTNNPTATDDLPFVLQGTTSNEVALSFNGSTNYLGTWAAGNVSDKMLDTYDFSGGWTIEATFKPNKLNVFQVLLGMDGQRGDLGGTVDAASPFWLKILANTQKLEFLAVDDTDTQNHVIPTIDPLVAGHWYSVAVTYDTSTLSFYLKQQDGNGYVLQGSTSVTNGISFGSYSNFWTVGRGMFNGAPVDAFDGIIDEVRVSDVALGTNDFINQDGFSTTFETLAYWRFEEGATGAGDAGIHGGDIDDHYADVSGNGNHMQTWDLDVPHANRPVYTGTVPFSAIAGVGANGLALDFSSGPEDIGTFGFRGAPKMVESYLFDTWTVEATFKVNSLGFQVLVGKDGKRGDIGGTGGVGPEAPFWLKILGFNQHLEVLAIDDNDTFHVAGSLDPIQSNEWYSVAARFDGTAIDLWLKGPGDTDYVFQNASDFFGPDNGGVGCSLGGFSGPGVLNEGAWSIGRGAFDGNPVDFVDGIVDEVRISNYAVSPADFLRAVNALPPIGDIAVEAVPGGLDLTWTTDSDYTYRLLEKNNLATDPTWTTNRSGIPGGASSVTVTVPTTNSAAFYKAESEQ